LRHRAVKEEPNVVVDEEMLPFPRERKTSVTHKKYSVKHTPVAAGLSAYLKNKKVDEASEDGDFEGVNKSAIQARLNRQKKKAYIKGLEDHRNKLDKENKSLKREVHLLQNDKDSLQEEVQYLKSVLANQSALSALLKNIPHADGIRLSSSFEMARTLDDHDYGKPAKKRRFFERVPSGGVCLHVRDSSNVSLEFCAHCSKMATGSVDNNDI
jgi:hypothetical protein